MSKTNYELESVNWEEIEKLSNNIFEKIKKDEINIDVIVPILRGGMPLALLLSSLLDVKEMSCLHISRSLTDEANSEFGEAVSKGLTNSSRINNSNVLIVDDTLDTKKTMDYAISIINKYNPKKIYIAVLYNFNKSTFKEIYSGKEMYDYKWIVFPWDKNKK